MGVEEPEGLVQPQRWTRRLSRDRAALLIVYASVTLTFVSLAACEREDRRFREAPPSAQIVNTIQVSGLHPGTAQMPTPEIPSTYDESAYTVSEGQKLFANFNCTGCHSNGGGGIGPPLMDNQWIYGSDPANIFATIMEGRPNGMPSFRGKIPEDQAWELAAYVRSLSGLLRKDVAPSRSDQMSGTPVPESTPKQTPTGIAPHPEMKK